MFKELSYQEQWHKARAKITGPRESKVDRAKVFGGYHNNTMTLSSGCSQIESMFDPVS